VGRYATKDWRRLSIHHEYGYLDQRRCSGPQQKPKGAGLTLPPHNAPKEELASWACGLPRALWRPGGQIVEKGDEIQIADSPEGPLVADSGGKTLSLSGAGILRSAVLGA